MNEYRTRLIADVVTGKVDVRDVPVEEIPEDEALDEDSVSEAGEGILNNNEEEDAVEQAL